MNKILAIVDDSPLMREALTDLFKLTFKKDLEVVSFYGGEEILRAIRNGKRYTAVLMDAKLGDGYTGPKYTAAILALSPETVVIGFSSESELATEFIKNGAKLFLPKTAALADIDQVIKSSLGM